MSRSPSIIHGKEPLVSIRGMLSNGFMAFDQKAYDKAVRAAKAIAEGREPGRIGRPPVLLTDEQKEAARKRHSRRTSLNTMARKKEARVTRAIAEGREPGKVGQPRTLTDDERKAARKASYQQWRDANIVELRIRQNEKRKARTAARAIADGRVPGTLGHLSTFTAEQLAQYKRDWTDHNHIFYGRIKTANSRAKRAGVGGYLTLREVLEIYDEQVGHCAFCAQPFGDEIPEIDHWEPISRGGKNVRSNIKLLHLTCNRTKGSKHPTTFGLVVDADGSTT